MAVKTGTGEFVYVAGFTWGGDLEVAKLAVTQRSDKRIRTEAHELTRYRRTHKPPFGHSTPMEALLALQKNRTEYVESCKREVSNAVEQLDAVAAEIAKRRKKP